MSTGRRSPSRGKRRPDTGFKLMTVRLSTRYNTRLGCSTPKCEQARHGGLGQKVSRRVLLYRGSIIVGRQATIRAHALVTAETYFIFLLESFRPPLSPPYLSFWRTRFSNILITYCIAFTTQQRFRLTHARFGGGASPPPPPPPPAMLPPSFPLASRVPDSCRFYPRNLAHALKQSRVRHHA